MLESERLLLYEIPEPSGERIRIHSNLLTSQGCYGNRIFLAPFKHSLFLLKPKPKRTYRPSKHSTHHKWKFLPSVPSHWRRNKHTLVCGGGEEGVVAQVNPKTSGGPAVEKRLFLRVIGGMGSGKMGRGGEGKTREWQSEGMALSCLFRPPPLRSLFFFQKKGKRTCCVCGAESGSGGGGGEEASFSSSSAVAAPRGPASEKKEEGEEGLRSERTSEWVCEMKPAAEEKRRET